jgi:hypothetical protein
MPQAITTRQRPSHIHGARPAGNAILASGERPLTAGEVQAALASIPPDSVTARTAGALRVAGPRHSVEEEQAAFEQAVAFENAGQATQ